MNVLKKNHISTIFTIVFVRNSYLCMPFDQNDDSKRYETMPLVIKGPGAGAEVTAAGVFADILETTTRKL